MTDTPVSRDALLVWAAAELKETGVPEARREAWRIWADTAGLPSYAALRGGRERVEPMQEERFRSAVGRRRAGEPLAYATGITGFRRLTLRADRRALIPRPETEGLVELVLRRTSRGRVADIGTGSGCIALALADEGGYDLVLGVDRSAAALALAAENRHLTGQRVELVRGHLAEALPPGSLDALIANPPYLSAEEYEGLDHSVRGFEPTEALVSGRDGLAATAALIGDGQRVLRRGGLLALEVDTTRAATVAGMAAAAGWDAVAVQEDLFGRARYVLARRSEGT